MGCFQQDRAPALRELQGSTQPVQGEPGEGGEGDSQSPLPGTCLEGRAPDWTSRPPAQDGASPSKSPSVWASVDMAEMLLGVRVQAEGAQGRSSGREEHVSDRLSGSKPATPSLSGGSWPG